MIKIGLLGAKGRMGQIVARLIESEFSTQAALGASLARGGDFTSLTDCDVVIDFSSSDAMSACAAQLADRTGKLPAFVVGSTGWNIDQKRKLEALAAKTPVLMASNFSTGVLALLEILKHASPLMKKLGYHPSLVETHHVHKKDSPSGTALSIQRVISPMGPGNVPIHSIRAGEVIGDHEVTFFGKDDRIVLGHFAQDRSVFARGAIQCALWLAAQKAAPTGKLLGIDAYFSSL